MRPNSWPHNWRAWGHRRFPQRLCFHPSAGGGSAQMQRLLEAKARALSLKERYLEALEPSGGIAK